jgi:hypothetical protein
MKIRAYKTKRIPNDHQKSTGRIRQTYFISFISMLLAKQLNTFHVQLGLSVVTKPHSLSVQPFTLCIQSYQISGYMILSYVTSSYVILSYTAALGNATIM